MSREDRKTAAHLLEMAAQAHHEAAERHRRDDAAQAHDNSTNAQSHTKMTHEYSGVTQSKTRKTATVH
jgi:hypothetical protein